METYLKEPTTVPFDSLYLDPNNPRLAPEDPPGYQDAKKLLDKKLQKVLSERAEEAFDLDALEDAVIGQGWMPIDAILIWEHPDASNQHVVVEGNRRIATLRTRIRVRLPKEREKLEKMENGRKRYSKHDIAEQKALVESLERVIADTENIPVVPIDATTPEELEKKLPRVLAVRHITGAKEWGNYAEDLWLLKRYEDLFEDKHPGDDLRWEQDIIAQVAHEASLGPVKTKRQLRAASAFSHFQRDFEDDLPAGEEFGPSDYYLFEQIVAKRFPREQFELGEDDLHIPSNREEVLFKWVFTKPRGNSADENENIFYRHENISLWDKIKRYDDQHGTGFAGRFDVDDPDSAPSMHSVEADYLAHKARRQPVDVLESLVGQLDAINAGTIRAEGDFLKGYLEQVQERTDKLLAMVEASEKAA